MLQLPPEQRQPLLRCRALPHRNEAVRVAFLLGEREALQQRVVAGEVGRQVAVGQDQQPHTFGHGRLEPRPALRIEAGPGTAVYDRESGDPQQRRGQTIVGEVGVETSTTVRPAVPVATNA